MNIYLSLSEARLIQEYLDTRRKLVLHYDFGNPKAVIVVEDGNIRLGEEAGRLPGAAYYLFAGYRLSPMQNVLIEASDLTQDDSLTDI